tara:strand:+ start:5039 stop:6466 length:1428 start_codon:yes stop_codon:yes gene_type:complete
MNILSKSKSLKGSPTVLKNTIAFAVIDDRHIIKHDLVKYIVETYTENTVYNFYKRKCDILGFYKEENIDDAISDAYDKNYEMLVVMKNGTFMNTSFFFENVKKMLDNDIALMGHILDCKEHYYFVHEQCFFLNLKAWKLSGSPEYYSDNINVTKVERSKTNFHDDYTPKWIIKDDGLADVSKVLPGGYMMSELLKADYRVSPFTELRKLKWFTYHGDTMKCLMKSLSLNAKEYHHGFYSTETEKIDEVKFNDNIDTLISIASAFHPFKVIKKSNINPKNILMYDISHEAIRIYQRMFMAWDGNDYIELLNNCDFEYRSGHNERLAQKSFDEMKVLCSWIYWKPFFNDITCKNIDYLRGNLLTETFHKKFINYVNKDEIALFHVSNIFSYEAETYYYDIFQRFFSFYNLYLLMKKYSKKTIFKGSIFNLKNYVSTDDMKLHHWYAKATQLALTPWQKERLPDFKKSLKKREEEICD